MQWEAPIGVCSTACGPLLVLGIMQFRSDPMAAINYNNIIQIEFANQSTNTVYRLLYIS